MTKQTQAQDFGIKDPWGRAIGASVTTWEDEGAAQPFALVVQATRDGAKYGSWNRPRYFTTWDERTKAIAKYIRGAARNAEKVAARGTLAQRRAQS